MQTARFLKPHDIKIAEEDIPIPQNDEILVKVKNSGICGTDYHIYEGGIQGLVEPGTILGHEFAGVIEELGSNVGDLEVGDRVAIEPNLFCGKCHYCRNAKKHFCENWAAIGLSRDGGFSEFCAVPSSSVYKMPKNLSFRNAAFFEPMACVLHGIERGRISVGETVVIQGAGSIGQLYIQALSHLGVDKIIVSDIDDQKLELAKKFGADITVNPQSENLINIVKSETNNLGAQVMVDAAGLLSTIPDALNLLENTGRVVIFGVPPENKPTNVVPYDIYRKEIEIIGSFTNPYTNEAALKMLKNIDINPILTNLIKLEGLIDDGMKKIGTSGVLKVQIEF
ncbi:MAG: alcohol dehydrogenase catalytic domain-containing protein, partial [Candidatus Lokiarchaeota archaeon]|nr:alcohol dehydrogenase catalytic domain-containing protein [Candidatus Lokiarchaeota archaeon]